MMPIIQRAGRVLPVLVLTIILLTAPAAWASPGAVVHPDGWWTQLWTHLTAWFAPAESGASMDPDGLQGAAEDEGTTTETWEPIPVEPGITDASSDEDDRGSSIDPDG